MSKPRYMRVIDKVRQAIADEAARGAYPILRPWELCEKLKVKQSVIDQACAVLQKEGVLETRRLTRGAYSIKSVKTKSPAYLCVRCCDEGSVYDRTAKSFVPCPRCQAGQAPKRRKVRWGGKKKLLALIRKSKPWVVEQWYEREQRWFMYMEAGCDRDPTHQTVAGCTDMKSIDPEDQPDLPRNVIERWHFTLEAAVEACGIVRRRHPKETFRTRDTSAGDFLMGAIL